MHRIILDVTEEQNPASYWLGSVAQATMHTYVDSILLIPELTDLASKQLVADIGKFIYVYLRCSLVDIVFYIYYT